MSGMASGGTPQPGTPEYDDMITRMVEKSTAASGVPFYVEDPEIVDHIASTFAAAALTPNPATPQPSSAESESAA